MVTPSSSSRIVEIDYLRGLAMISMVYLHTGVYFLSPRTLPMFLWNWGQFAVQTFIFCSVILFFFKSQIFNFVYIKKRFWRLLYPYYIFVPFFLAAVFLREPHKLTLNYIKDSFLILGGIDINWLVLLFLQLTFIVPLVSFLWKKIRVGFYIYFVLSVSSSLLFVFMRWPFDYKWIMWLPYSLLVIYAMLFSLLQKSRIFHVVSLCVSALVFILLRIIEVKMIHPLNFFDNKYPPNLYYLSYGIFVIELLFLLAKRGAFSLFMVRQFLTFLSKYSYSIFFIHYLVLYLFVGFLRLSSFNWFTFFALVLFISIVVQFSIQRGLGAINRKKREQLLGL